MGKWGVWKFNTTALKGTAQFKAWFKRHHQVGREAARQEGFDVGAMLKHGRGVGAPDPVRGYAWLKLSATNGEQLALKNLTGFDDLFTDDVRKRGMEHLEIVKQMILKNGDDRRLVMGDMTY